MFGVSNTETETSVSTAKGPLRTLKTLRTLETPGYHLEASFVPSNPICPHRPGEAGWTRTASPGSAAPPRGNTVSRLQYGSGILFERLDRRQPPTNMHACHVRSCSGLGPTPNLGKVYEGSEPLTVCSTSMAFSIIRSSGNFVSISVTSAWPRL